MLLGRKDDVRLPYLGKFTFYHGLAISLLLHVSLALPFFLTPMHTAEQSKQEKLKIELFGMISNRQMEEKHKGTETPQQAQRPVQQMNNAVARSSPDKYRTVTTESPVHVEKEDEAVPGPMPVSSASLQVDSSPAGAVVEQKQQTINYEELIQDYKSRVSKRIQDNLVYPNELREKGITGTTKIAFTITASGDISSLRVVRGSGSDELDSRALKAARASAPFEIPPKPIPFVMELDFQRDS